MKYILFIFFICSSYFSFGQMTVSEMMKIYKMDMDQFETYALNKGYKFKEIFNDYDRYGHAYMKGYRENTKYLTLYKEFPFYGINVNYQTSNTSEYLNFKNQLKNLGFVLHSEETFKDEPRKVYRNKTYEIEIYITKDEVYEIGLHKF